MTLAVNTLGRSIRRLTGVAGPMFAKEMLITSRRGRSYVLRAAYVATMMVYVVGVYISMAPHGANLSIYEMPHVGKTIVASLAGFQLAGVTLVAIGLLSTAFNEEISRRTLGALLTTPLTDTQLIMGKLAGRVIQLLTLIVLGLPMLITLQVFGGVDFMYIGASTCVTLSSAVMAGALTLRVSLRFHSALATAMTSVAILGGYCLMTSLSLLCCCPVFMVAGLANPALALGNLTMNLMAPGSSPVPWLWPIQCVAMLVVAWLLIRSTAKRIRRVAGERLFHQDDQPLPLPGPEQQKQLAQLIHDPHLAPPLPDYPPGDRQAPPPLPHQQVPGAAFQRPPKAFGGHSAPPEIPFSMEVPRPSYAGPSAATAVYDRPKRRTLIRSVHGSPVLWLELQKQFLRKVPMIPLVCGITILVLFNGAMAAANTITSRVTQAVVTDVYLVMTLLALCIASAGTLARERESRSLTALLTTPMADWRILADKAAAAILLVWPLWVLLVGNAVLFFVLGVIKPLSLMLASVSIVGVTSLHLGFGLFLGSRLKRTTSVLAGNLLLGAVVWLGLPILLGILNTIMPNPAWEILQTSNPFIQIYYTVSEKANNPDLMMFLLGAWNAIYLAAGAAFAYTAMKNLRRDNT